MPGPVSMPAQDSKRWNEMNEIVCAIHYTCDMAEFDKNDKPVKHDYITYRVWLLRRNRLRTGKTA